jgi:hypothetical protein
VGGCCRTPVVVLAPAAHPLSGRQDRSIHCCEAAPSRSPKALGDLHEPEGGYFDPTVLGHSQREQSS